MEETENIVTANTFKEEVAEVAVPMEPPTEPTQEAPVFDPVASASQIFKTYFPIYCKQLDKLSRKQILRLNKAVIGLPLEEGFKPNLKNTEEMQAYYVLERLFQAKMVIFHHVMTEHQHKQELKAAEEASKPPAEEKGVD